MRKTSIIIVTYNNLKYNKDCLDSIRKYTEKGTYEIIVIDNNSTDGTRTYLEKQKDIKLILNKTNLGYVLACNEGIDLYGQDNDILLLNNDTIVTKNWLNNLKICLESSKNIGAVGSVSNNNENLQGEYLEYHNLKELQEVASLNNISDKRRWEEKVFLIGYCLLIKREVINKIRLDENYNPGYIDDNDLSCQIINKGYKLMLCHDSFIHHYLGVAFRKDLDKFYKILNKNRNYFKKKWGFNTYCFDEIKEASMPLINNPKKILELDCGIGTNILKLKYNFSNVNIAGVEKNKYKRNMASKFSRVYSSLDLVKEKDFDYILLGNVLEKRKINLRKVIKYLKPGGYIIGEIHNVSYLDNIKYLLDNQNINSFNKIKYWWGINDIIDLFLNLGFTNQFIYSWYTKISDNDKYYKTLKALTKKEYNISYFTFRFQKKSL